MIAWRKIGVVVACNLAHTLFVGMPLAGGVLYVEWCSTFFDTSRELIAWIISLNNGLLLAGGPLASLLISKIGFCGCFVLGIAISASSIIAAVFSPNVIFLIVLFGVLTGIGNCLAYIPSAVVFNLWFEKKQILLVNAVVTSGIAVGMFGGSFVLEFLLEKYGWPGCLMLYAGIILQGLLFAQFMREPIASAEHEAPPSERKSNEAETEETITSINPHAKLFQQWNFIILLFGEVFWNIGCIIFVSVLSETAKQAGHSQKDAAYLVSINGIANFFGRFVAAFLSFQQRLRHLTLFMLSCGMSGIPQILVPFVAKWYACLATLSAMHGLLFGVQLTALAPTVIEVLSIDCLVHGFGWLMLADGTGVISGAPLAGFIFDHTGSYDIAFYVGGASTFMSVILMGVVKRRMMIKSFKHKQSYTITNLQVEEKT